MKKNILVSFAALFCIFAFENCNAFKKSKTAEEGNHFEGGLVEYGKYIYARESCSSCHTVNIDEAQPGIISLDGLKGKYSTSWLFYFLEDPQMLSFNSKMPSYSHVLQNDLSKETFVSILQANDLNDANSKTDSIWQDLNLKADTLLNELDIRQIRAKERTEGLALIAYLQQIPPSKSQMRMHSIEKAKQEEKSNIWDNAAQNNFAFVLETSTKDGSYERGKDNFNIICSICHGQYGEGGIGPNLTDDYWLHGGEDLEIAKTIIYGIPEKGMISWKNQFTPKEIGELLAFVKTLRDTNPDNPKAPQGVKE